MPLPDYPTPSWPHRSSSKETTRGGAITAGPDPEVAGGRLSASWGARPGSQTTSPRRGRMSTMASWARSGLRGAERPTCSRHSRAPLRHAKAEETGQFISRNLFHRSSFGQPSGPAGATLRTLRFTGLLRAIVIVDRDRIFSGWPRRFAIPTFGPRRARPAIGLRSPGRPRYCSERQILC